MDPRISILAQVTINSEGSFLSGESLERFVEDNFSYHVDAIGLDRSEGPRLMLESLERLRELTTLPLSVQPNRGVNRSNIGGRNLIYDFTGTYGGICQTILFRKTGVFIVGGCCGTNPTHIKAIRRAAHGLQPSKRMDVSWQK